MHNATLLELNARAGARIGDAPTRLSVLGPASRQVWLAIGVVLVVAAALLPPAEFIAYLRGDASSVTSQLVLGAELFKIGLAVLGLLCVILPRLALWDRATPAAAKASDAQSERWTLVGLAAILLASAGLRLYGLQSGAWLDEVLTYVHYMQLSFGQNITTFDSQNQHFVYSILAHASGQLFGYTVWASRLPAAIFGIAGVGALYLLAREVIGRREALLASALLAVSYQHIWYSQTARGYSGLLFWSLLSSWLLLRALREKRSILWLCYAVSVALGTYTHMTMLFVVMGQFAVFCVVVARCRPLSSTLWPGIVLGFGLSAVLVLQLYALVLPQFLSGTLDEQSVVAEWKSPLWTLIEVARSFETSFSGGGLVLVPALLIFGLGLLSYARAGGGGLALLQLLLIPVILCAGVNLWLGHHLWPRFFFFAAGFLVLVAVRGVLAAGDLAGTLLRRRGLGQWLGTAMCLGALLVSARSIPIAYLPKQDYAGALEYVQANRLPGDSIAVAGLAVYPYEEMYRVDWQSVTSGQDLHALRAQGQRTWVVYTLPEVLASVSPDLMQEIQSEYTLVQAFPGTLDDGTVFVYRADGAGGQASS